MAPRAQSREPRYFDRGSFIFGYRGATEVLQGASPSVAAGLAAFGLEPAVRDTDSAFQQNR